MESFNNEDPSIKELENLQNNLRAIIFHVDAIENEEDPEIVKVHLEALEELNPNEESIKESIRIGLGDYKKIQKKCINMGVV